MIDYQRIVMNIHRNMRFDRHGLHEQSRADLIVLGVGHEYLGP